MKLSEALLQIAKKDLDAARHLYEKELYPQAVFYLQQSVEKAAKSFAIMTNMLKEGEVKTKIGHNPLRIHKRLLNEQLEKLESLNRAFDAIPRFREASLIKGIDTGEVREYLGKPQKALGSLNQEKLAFPSKQEISQIITDLKRLELQAEEMKVTPFSISNEEFTTFKQNVSELLDVFHEYNPQEVEKAKKELSALSLSLLEELLKKLIPLLADFYYLHLSLFCLSILTFPHAVIARYPNDKLNPLEIYKRGFPLIELFRECVEIMEKVLTRIKHFKNFKEGGSPTATVGA